MRRRQGEGAGAYGRLVDEAAAQLDGQLFFDGSALSTLVVVPVVGFGGQSVRVVERTMRLLLDDAASALGGGRRCIVAVVNRPEGRPPDDTVRRLEGVRADLAASGRDAVQLAVCDVGLQRRPRIGEVRQLGLDAVERVCGPLSAGGVLVVADDDLVLVPRGTLAGLEGAVGGGAALAVGPVMFDHLEVPTWRVADLFVAELVRALLVERLVSALADPAAALTLPDQSVCESLVLSGHLAVRRDALEVIGGFRDLNEITWLMRDVLTTRGHRLARPPACAPAATADDAEPLARLRREAVRVSSRRALLAWRAGRHPTVAQWRACRFRASRVDEARLARFAADECVVLLRESERAARDEFVASAERMIATTFEHLRPSLELARWALAQVGVEAADVRLWAPADRSEWRLRLRRPAAFVERVMALQRTDESHLADRGEALVVPRADVRLLGLARS